MTGRAQRRFLAGAAVAVAAAVAAGLWLAGSPLEERARRIDDLGLLAAALEQHWSRTRELPDTLAALDAPSRRPLQLADPVSEIPYDYRRLGRTRFELCASFERASAEHGDPRQSSFWAHGAGRHCFELDVGTGPR